MSGSGKSLLGLWLYRTGEDWTLRESSQQSDVRHDYKLKLHEGKKTSVLLCYILFQLRPVSGLSESTRHDNRNSVIFSLKNQVGGLARALQVFQVSQ